MVALQRIGDARQSQRLAMILTQIELLAITRRDRPSAQARVLKRLGIPFRVHPSDGILLVPRDAAKTALGGDVTPAANDPQAFEVNVNAMRSKRGQTTQAVRSR